MSDIYLVRHGQAGTRRAYDALSDLGRDQSRRLGEFFASQNIRFAHACAGELSRQRQTAEAVRVGYGDHFPDIAVDGGWNEFDLDRMYREIAPQLCAADAEFKREYEAMRRQARESEGRHSDDVNRRWLPCDSSVVNAWIAAKHAYSGETWRQFHQRIATSLHRLVSDHPSGNIAVFTSAMPIAICAGLALGIDEHRSMNLAAVLQNASFTMLQAREQGVRMFSFNHTPHLSSSDLRTFR